MSCSELRLFEIQVFSPIVTVTLGTVSSNSESTDSGMPFENKTPLADLDMISSIEGIERVLPEYAGEIDMPPSRVGIGDDNPEWEQDTYSFHPASIVARLFNEIPNCVLIIDNADVLDSVNELSPGSFGRVVVGECVDFVFDDETITLTVRNLQYVTILYASGLLLTRYEKELSTRVLNDAPEFAVDAVNRKYRKSKRDLRRKIDSQGDKSEILVSDSGIDVYGVRLEALET